jgi:hypothetical protein
MVEQSIVTNTMAGAKLWLELFVFEQQKELMVCFSTSKNG